MTVYSLSTTQWPNTYGGKKRNIGMSVNFIENKCYIFNVPPPLYPRHASQLTTFLKMIKCFISNARIHHMINSSIINYTIKSGWGNGEQ